MEKKKMPFDILDSIRGIAAFYVAFCHCRGSLWIGGAEFAKVFPRSGWGFGDYLMFGSSMLTRLAVEFVIIFFVLSGFSIAHSLSANKSPLQFYKRRFIRIYPSYVVALIWAGLVFVITKMWYPQWYNGNLSTFCFTRTMEMRNYFDWHIMIKNLLYMPSEGFIKPFWSLTYEVIFYLLAPFLLRRVNLYAAISIILFAANLLMRGKILSLGLPVYIHDFLFEFNIYFVAGVVLYKNFSYVLELASRVSRKTMLTAIIGVLLVTYAIAIYRQAESQYSFMSAALLSVLLIVYFLKYEVRIKWLMGAGRFSYTLYITHFASVFLYLGIYWLIVHPTTPYILNYFVWMPAVPFVIGMAYIQYYFVERKTKDILKKMRTKNAKFMTLETTDNRQ